MRLAEKGYKVAVLEKGRRLQSKDFPKSNWSIRKYLWLPLLRFFGPQEISLFNGAMVLHGSGVGGGSLVYANTLLRPNEKIFFGKEWPTGIPWWEKLRPCYERAEKMLGVTINKTHYDSDKALDHLAQLWNRKDNYKQVPVGVYFGGDGAAPSTEGDPYFGGEGPKRTPCTHCGGCMIGCRVGAKNTLDKNYLYFAEKHGAEVIADAAVDKIIPEQDGYRVVFQNTQSFAPRFSSKSLRSKKVILAAGVLGTLKILLKNKHYHKTLPNISSRLGKGIRTNGESLLGITSFDKKYDFSKGIAIGSSLQWDENTKIETVRYPRGSSLLRFLAVPLTAEYSPLSRPLMGVINIFKSAFSYIKLIAAGDWAKQSVILLVMQSIDQKMSLGLKRSILNPFWFRFKRQDEEKIPAYLEVGQKSVKYLEKELNGFGQNVASEVFLNTPATAHILGGCNMAESIDTGVVDADHKIFGYEGLYVCDGSVIPSNLGVNPSLTISALAENFARQFEEKQNS